MKRKTDEIKQRSLIKQWPRFSFMLFQQSTMQFVCMNLVACFPKELAANWSISAHIQNSEPLQKMRKKNFRKYYSSFGHSVTEFLATHSLWNLDVCFECWKLSVEPHSVRFPVWSRFFNLHVIFFSFLFSNKIHYSWTVGRRIVAIERVWNVDFLENVCSAIVWIWFRFRFGFWFLNESFDAMLSNSCSKLFQKPIEPKKVHNKQQTHSNDLRFVNFYVNTICTLYTTNNSEWITSTMHSMFWYLAYRHYPWPIRKETQNIFLTNVNRKNTETNNNQMVTGYRIKKNRRKQMSTSIKMKNKKIVQIEMNIIETKGNGQLLAFSTFHYSIEMAKPEN